MILKLLLSIEMICKMFRKTLMTTMWIKNAKYTVFHGMIADMIDNKKQNSIVTQLFIRSRN